MVISLYQINNVLRVYGDQLRQNKGSNDQKSENIHQSDKISISAEAKRKNIIDKVSSDIVDRITKYGPNDGVEREIFKKLENEYGANLEIIDKGFGDLIFKVIDENGESTNMLSIEDSKFLSHNLKNITKDIVDKNIM